MGRYVVKRVAYMIFTLWVIVTLTFVMMHAVPGNPFTSERMTPGVMAQMKAKYGLDDPLYVQYFVYLGNLLKGDLGISMKHLNRTVNDIISSHVTVSAKLGMWALLYGIPGGIGLGILAAFRRNKLSDRAAMVVSVLGISVPGFIFATLLQLLFGVQWKHWFGETLFPVAGWGTPIKVVLPAFCLGVGALASYTRMMRTSVLDVLGQDYIKTAKAKGLSNGEVIWRHVLRNSMLPIITMLGLTIVGTLLGSMVIEQIFAIPGLGSYFVDSITNSDYTMILGTTVFWAVLLVISMFLVDIAYALVDPRIRLDKSKA